MTSDADLLNTMQNLARFHREHEKFYSSAPLEGAVRLQGASRILKTLADRWKTIIPAPSGAQSPFAGAEDLNETANIQETGVLFMEGGGEPAEITRLKRDLDLTASDMAEIGNWLANAMESSWEFVRVIIPDPALASVLGERHRIISNDWLAASMCTLLSRLLRRSLDILQVLDFSTPAVRADLSGQQTYPAYMYSASELIARAADLAAESALLIHDNERRWRLLLERLTEVARQRGGAT